MSVATVLSLSTTVTAIGALGVVAFMTLATWFLFGWLPRRRLRQNRAATQLFNDSEIWTWRTTAVCDWSDEERDTAMRYYNNAGRQARIGRIRVDSIPEDHQGNIVQLVGTMRDDEAADHERWSDLMWLGKRLQKRATTKSGAALIAEPKPDTEPEIEPTGTPDPDAASPSSTLGLNGSKVDIDEIENTTDAKTDTGESDAEPPADDLAQAPQSDDGAQTSEPGHLVLESAETAPQEASDSSKSAEGEAGSLPNVPGWILEAREALRTSPTSEPTTEDVDADADAAKPVLSGSDFPWPETTAPTDSETASEPVETVPEDDLDTAAEDDPVSSVDPEAIESESTSEPEVIKSSRFTPVQNLGADDEAPMATPPKELPPDDAPDPDSFDEATDESAKSSKVKSRSDEIKRLKRKAKKARRRSDQARNLAVQFAREGRRKKARAAAKVALEQSEQAKRFKKRARKLAKK